MQRLILSLFFMLPWWAFFAFSGGVAWMGYEAYQAKMVEQAERHAQAERPMPEIVDLSDFDRQKDIAPGNEVHVRGWIDGEHNYELIQTSKGVRTGTRFMFMLFGTEDDESAKVVKAAIIMTEADRDRFVDQVFDHAVDFGEQGLILGLNGFKGDGDGFLTLAYDSIKDEGLVQSTDFIFIEPFLDGREAALTATGEPIRAFGSFLLFAAAFAMVGVFKLTRKRAARPQKARPAKVTDPFANGPIAGQGAPAAPATPAAPVTSGAVMADSVTDDTPLGRIKRRQEEERAAVLAAEQARHAPQATAPDATQREAAPMAKPVRRSLWPQLLAGAVVLAALSFMVPGVASAAGIMIPLAMMAAIWFFIFKAGKKVEGGLNALRGVEAKTETVATVAGMNMTSTKRVPRAGGSILSGLFKGRDKPAAPVKRDMNAATRAKRAADPFDKLAAQVRSGR